MALWYLFWLEGLLYGTRSKASQALTFPGLHIKIKNVFHAVPVQTAAHTGFFYEGMKGRGKKQWQQKRNSIV